MKLNTCETVQTTKVVNYLGTTFIIPNNIKYMAINSDNVLYGFINKPQLSLDDNETTFFTPMGEVIIATDCELVGEHKDSLRPVL